MGRHTLRITFEESTNTATVKLEGRLAGPWVDELSHAWVEAAPRLAAKKLSIDLSDVTYADARGKQVLREISSQAGPQFVTSTPWTQFLAEEVSGGKTDRI